ncbi:MAG: hypothetical protein AABY18_04810 [Candidatus Thermoplasmatota archaeon]
MRLAACLALLLLLAGCSSPPNDVATDETPAAGADPVEGTAADSTTKATTAKLTAVQDTVAFSGIIGAGVCFFDGSQVSCANLPSATPVSTDSYNVLRYVHDRQAQLSGGALTVSWGPSGGMGLSATVYVYTGCNPTCEVVSELTDGRATGGPAGGSFSLDVPAYTPQPGELLGVRIAPLLATSVASAHTGFEVDMTGTLDFQVAT